MIDTEEGLTYYVYLHLFLVLSTSARASAIAWLRCNLIRSTTAAPHISHFLPDAMVWLLYLLPHLEG